MPKDEWKRARNQSIARRAKIQRTTGSPWPYEFLSDEITPLDKINVFDRAAGAAEPDPNPPNPSQPHLSPRQHLTGARPKLYNKSIRFAPAQVSAS